MTPNPEQKSNARRAKPTDNKKNITDNATALIRLILSRLETTAGFFVYLQKTYRRLKSKSKMNNR